jgi:putative ABC transport system permease protein
MLPTFTGVIGVLAALSVAVGVTTLAALATFLRPSGTRRPLAASRPSTTPLPSATRTTAHRLSDAQTTARRPPDVRTTAMPPHPLGVWVAAVLNQLRLWAAAALHRTRATAHHPSAPTTPPPSDTRPTARHPSNAQATTHHHSDTQTMLAAGHPSDGRTTATTQRPSGVRAAAAVLVAAVALTTAGATIASSAQRSAALAFDAIQADLVIHGDRPMDPTTLDAVRAIRSVDLAARGATERVTVDGVSTTIAAWDDNGAANLLLARRATSGTIETLATGQLLMSRRTADRFDASVGDRLTVRFSGSDARELRLVGIYADTPVDPGIVVSWSDAAPDPGATAMLVKLAPGTPVTDAVRQAETLLAGQPGATVRTTERAAADFTGPVGAIQVGVWVLLALAICFAALGIARSSAPSDTLARDTAVASVFASVAGAAAGAILGATAVWALGARGVTALAIPWPQLAACIMAAGAIGALATLLPASRVRGR